MSYLNPLTWFSLVFSTLGDPYTLTFTGHETTDSIISTIVIIYFVFQVFNAIIVTWTSVRQLLDLCARGLDDTQALDELSTTPSEYESDLRILFFRRRETETLEEEGQEQDPSSRNNTNHHKRALTPGHHETRNEDQGPGRGRSQEREHVSLSRGRYSEHDRRVFDTDSSIVRRHDSNLCQQHRRQLPMTSILSPSSKSYYPESHRAESNRLYSTLAESTGQRLRDQVSRRSQEEAIRQYCIVDSGQAAEDSLSRPISTREPLDRWHEVGNMSDGFDHVTGNENHTSDKDGEVDLQKENESVNLPVLLVESAGPIRHEVSSISPSVEQNSGDESGLQASQSACLRGGGETGYDPDEDDEGVEWEYDSSREEEEEGEEVDHDDLIFDMDPLEYDGPELTRYPSRYQSILYSVSDIDIRMDLSRIFPDRPSGLQEDNFQSAGPSTLSVSPEIESDHCDAGLTPVAGFLLQKPDNLLVDPEVAESLEYIAAELDAHYQHDILIRGQVTSLPRKVRKNIPLLKKATIHSELRARQAEIAVLTHEIFRLLGGYVTTVENFFEASSPSLPDGDAQHCGYVGSADMDGEEDDMDDYPRSYLIPHPQQSRGWKPRLRVSAFQNADQSGSMATSRSKSYVSSPLARRVHIALTSSSSDEDLSRKRNVPAARVRANAQPTRDHLGEPQLSGPEIWAETKGTESFLCGSSVDAHKRLNPFRACRFSCSRGGHPPVAWAQGRLPIKRRARRRRSSSLQPMSPVCWSITVADPPCAQPTGKQQTDKTCGCIHNPKFQTQNPSNPKSNLLFDSRSPTRLMAGPARQHRCYCCDGGFEDVEMVGLKLVLRSPCTQRSHEPSRKARRAAGGGGPWPWPGPGGPIPDPVAPPYG